MEEFSWPVIARCRLRMYSIFLSWTAEEILFAGLFPVKTVAEIEEGFGRDLPFAYGRSHRRARGETIPAAAGRLLLSYLRLYPGEFFLSQIAWFFGISEASITRLAKEHGISLAPWHELSPLLVRHLVLNPVLPGWRMGDILLVQLFRAAGEDEAALRRRFPQKERAELKAAISYKHPFQVRCQAPHRGAPGFGQRIPPVIFAAMALQLGADPGCTVLSDFERFWSRDPNTIRLALRLCELTEKEWHHLRAQKRRASVGMTVSGVPLGDIAYCQILASAPEWDFFGGRLEVLANYSDEQQTVIDKTILTKRELALALDDLLRSYRGQIPFNVMARYFRKAAGSITRRCKKLKISLAPWRALIASDEYKQACAHFAKRYHEQASVERAAKRESLFSDALKRVRMWKRRPKTKYCTRCKRKLYKLTLFFYRKRGLDSLESICKICKSEVRSLNRSKASEG